MPVPSPRNPIRPARGNLSDLQANIANLYEGEICYALDSDSLYIKEGSTLIRVTAGNVMTLGGSQTITGDKTFSGLVDLTGTFKIDGVEVTATAAEINHLVGVTSGVQGQLDDLATDVSNLQTGTGLADGATGYAATITDDGFSGNTVTDGATVKQALIDIETALEGSNSDAVDLRTLSGTADGDTNYGTAASRSFEVIGGGATTLSALQALDADAHELGLNQSDLITLSGVSENATDLGTFTNGMITPSRTVKQALEQVGQAAEDNETDLSNLTLAVGNTNPSDLGIFTGSTLNDTESVKSALQKIVTELENGSGSLTGDTGTADFESGAVTVAGGTGLTTSATGSTLTVDLDDTAVTAASYGAADTVPTYTVDAQGRLTAAADVSIDIVHAQVSDFDAGVQANTLDSLAQPVAEVALNNQRITGLANPVGDQDAVTKSYADALVTGLDVKQSARVATTADITISGTQAVDGINLVVGDRVLVKDQTDGSENGIWEVQSTTWTRTTDADNTPSGEVTSGMYIFIEEGSVNADAGFVLATTGTINLDTTVLTFVQFTGAGQVTAGAGLSKTGSVLNVGTADVARIVVNANDIDLAAHGTAGTYNGLTVDAYGRVSSFAQGTTLADYAITDAQPLDVTLTALAGVTTAADKLIYADGADSFATTDLSTFARSILDDADAAAARTTLGLGTMATQAASAVAITGGTIDNVVIDGGTF